MADKKLSYAQEQDRRNLTRIREILATLPGFCSEYIRGIENSTATRTRLAYAYDLRVFFEYMHEHIACCQDIPVTEMKLSVLDSITREDLEEYMSYLSLYGEDGEERVNGEQGKARKLSALRNMYDYFFQHEQITRNTAELIESPKLHDKAIIRLDPAETANLLDEVESGETLTAKERAYHNKTRARDVAILTLMLGTGIRVSECVGLDLTDLDFDNGAIKVHRKGGYEDIVYFGDEVEEALLDYLEEREHVEALAGSENALFLSMQRKRITVRAVENLVKKYATRLTTLKHITPHKLRSTYGTTLYRETGDIYLVASVLGHKDVNTTRKHYATIDDDKKRGAANVVRLRKD